MESDSAMSGFKMLQVCSLLVLVLVLSPVAGSHCSYLTRTAKCEGMNLNVIPDEIPFDVTALDLSNSSLATLDWTSLAEYNNIEKLKMMACNIEQLPDDFFSELQELVNLDLSYNRLAHVHKDTFKFNIRLRELALNGNKLHFDSGASFLVSSSIIHLQLRDCGIQKISNITFRDMKTLKHLDLSGNKINVLHSGALNYSALSHDTEYMRKNPINTYKTNDLKRYRKLKDNWEAFAHLAELHVVDLSYNELSKVDNTIFITNTKLVEVNLSGNKPFFDPAAHFLISSSIENLVLKSCGIRQVSDVTFSKMEKLKNLTLSGNSIVRLDPASFVGSSLRTLHVDYADDIESALFELICKNVAVSCDKSPCPVGSAGELHCNNLTRSKQPVISTPKEGHSSSASLEEPESTKVRAKQPVSFTPKNVHSSSASREEPETTEVRGEQPVSSTPKKVHSSSASREEPETTEVRAASTSVVIFCSSLAFVCTGLSVIVLVLYLKNQKSKTNDSRAETPSSPQIGIMDVGEYEVNDGYEVARTDNYFQRQPEVLPSAWWPSAVAPQRPLPSPPPYTRRVCSYHEYEAVE